MKNYIVSESCINCRACVEVAHDHFAMADNVAFVKKQPLTTQEEELCEKALEVCPVAAISIKNATEITGVKPIVANANIKETLDAHPQLKPILAALSPKFKRMQNPALYNTLARFANFRDAAKVTGLSMCEILHTINDYLGTDDKLIKAMPECIKQEPVVIADKSVAITWEESPERYIYNNDTFEELIKKVSGLPAQQNIVIISTENPNELLKVATGLHFLFNTEKNREYRISIFNPHKDIVVPWQDRKDSFEVLDVRTMQTDPFDIILKKAHETEDEDGFVLVQRFEPHPLITMLSEMDFEHLTEQVSESEVRIYFHKKKVAKSSSKSSGPKVDVVIQSATPVAYPVIMRLLQSSKIKEHFNITELKVWEETEKHLAWITSGKADISFSALITAVKLRTSDIKIPALFVWDNFVLLSRLDIRTLDDIKGEEIYLPLFEEAPPAKITQYLIAAKGLDPNDFTFTYGKPFGRPEEIYRDFVSGKAQTVVLREPEASYAIKIMEDRNEKISQISFNEVWNEVNNDFGSFPNAGLVVKGEFARNHPKESALFLEELQEAIQWVNDHKQNAAELAFDMMRQPVDRVRLFLDRVNFKYVAGEQLHYKVKQYFDILNKNEIVNVEMNDSFLDVFTME